MSDLPNRLGREMKYCASVFGAASWYSSSVLSTYFPSPASIRLGKSNTPVVGTLILRSSFSIATYYTKILCRVARFSEVHFPTVTLK